MNSGLSISIVAGTVVSPSTIERMMLGVKLAINCPLATIIPPRILCLCFHEFAHRRNRLPSKGLSVSLLRQAVRSNRPPLCRLPKPCIPLFLPFVVLCNLSGYIFIIEHLPDICQAVSETFWQRKTPPPEG